MTRSLRTTAFAVLAWTALATMAMADEWIDNYEEATDKVVDKLKTGDDVVFEAIDPRHIDQGILVIGGTL